MRIRKFLLVPAFVCVCAHAEGILDSAAIANAAEGRPSQDSALSVSQEADTADRVEALGVWHRQSALLVEDAAPTHVFGFSRLPGSNPTSRISRALDLVLREARPDDTVPVLIRFRDRALPEVERDRIRALPRSTRRDEGGRELRRRAERSQAAVVEYLRRLEATGEAQSIRPLWLVNAVAVEIPAARVYDLLRFPEVRSVG